MSSKSTELFGGMGLTNLESKLSGLKCELCNKPLEAEEYQEGNVVRLGPVCRRKVLTNNFGVLYKELDDKSSHDKATLLLSDKKDDIYNEFFEGDFESHEEFLMKVNSLRQTLNPEAEIIEFDEEKFLKMELKKLQKESKEFAPAYKALKKIGLTADDIKYAFDPEDLKNRIAKKGVSFTGSEEQLEQLFYEAQDYATRHDRIGLIKIALAPKEQLNDWASKREKDYQDLFKAGFTEEEILNNRNTSETINTNPVLRAKSLQYLMDKGIIKEIPKDEPTAIQTVADNLRKVQLVLKTGFWFTCCVMELGLWTAQSLSGKSSPKFFLRATRQHPLKLYKEYKAKQAKVKKERDKAYKEKLKNFAIEAEKKHIIEQHQIEERKQWEFVREQKANEIPFVDKSAFKKTSKKAI